MHALKRTFKRSSRDLPDPSDLRERIVAVVEQAIDRVEDVLADAPSASDVAAKGSDAAARMRRTRAWEVAGTAVATVGPTAMRMARNRSVRRNSLRAARVAPHFVRAHPVLLGVSLAAAAVAGVRLARRMRGGSSDAAAGTTELQRAHDAYVSETSPTAYDLPKEVSRMEGEGGDLGAYDGAPAASQPLARSSNGSDAASR